MRNVLNDIPSSLCPASRRFAGVDDTHKFDIESGGFKDSDMFVSLCTSDSVDVPCSLLSGSLGPGIPMHFSTYWWQVEGDSCPRLRDIVTFAQEQFSH